MVILRIPGVLIFPIQVISHGETLKSQISVYPHADLPWEGDIKVFR